MPSKTTVRAAKWAAIPVAMLASSALVWQASYSAFTATTSNPTSNWAAGTVELDHSDKSSALFTTGNLKPGDTGTKCIVVSSTGSLASTVKLYGTSYSAGTKSLGDHIDLVIDEGTAGAAGNCTGFAPLTPTPSVYTGTLSNFAGKTNFSNGWGTWAPTGAATETRTYRFKYTLNSSVPNSAQGGTASIAFTWEAQNS